LNHKEQINFTEPTFPTNNMKTVFFIATFTLLFKCISCARLIEDNAFKLISSPSACHHTLASDSYTLEYNYTLPLTAEMQPEPIKYHVKVYRDGKAKRSKIDTYEGVNVLIAKDSVEYSIVPRLDKQLCMAANDDYDDSDFHALPCLDGWEMGPPETVDDKEVDVWTFETQHQAKTVSYKFYYDSEQEQPVKLTMLGNDFLTHSHYDEYVIEYISYVPGRPESSEFHLPEVCDGVEPPSNNNNNNNDNEGDDDTTMMMRYARSHRHRMMSLIPHIHYGGDSPEYNAFLSSSHGSSRRLRSLKEYHTRKAIYMTNLQMINDHNAANRSYTMAVNKFADYSREEFVQLMLPNHNKNRYTNKENKKTDQDVRHKHQLDYKPIITDPAKLPATVDWRGTGAEGLVGGPKDQAACGSCWTFGATSAMESAWFMATGEAVSFSEQQIMDCSWGWVPEKPGANEACDGGDPWAAIGWVVDNGSVARTADYPYKGQDAYCIYNNTSNSTADDDDDEYKIKGYVRLEQGDENAVKEVLYTRGPLSVSIDASQPSFTFYSGGVYYDHNCMTGYDELDHAVTLVGYGAEHSGYANANGYQDYNANGGSTGNPYWLVRNSWSKAWGDGGYIKIAMENGGCGVATDAVFAVVGKEESILIK
jgi:C1A family cysteine protease